MNSAETDVAHLIAAYHATVRIIAINCFIADVRTIKHCDKTMATMFWDCFFGSLAYRACLKIFTSKSCCSQSQRLARRVDVVVVTSAVTHVLADDKMSKLSDGEVASLISLWQNERFIRLDALAWSIIATATWLGGWLSHSGIVSKPLNLSENFFDHLKAPSL